MQYYPWRKYFLKKEGQHRECRPVVLCIVHMRKIPDNATYRFFAYVTTNNPKVILS